MRFSLREAEQLNARPRLSLGDGNIVEKFKVIFVQSAGKNSYRGIAARSSRSRPFVSREFAPNGLEGLVSELDACLYSRQKADSSLLWKKRVPARGASIGTQWRLPFFS